MSQDWPHRRYNQLSGQWILCSPHRAKRPWLGQVEKLPSSDLPQYDPKCYLCPGNKRAQSDPNQDPPHNPKYTNTLVFDNDFSALLQQTHDDQSDFGNQSELENRLLKSQMVQGICKVVCFSPRHDLTVAEMNLADLVEVVNCWKSEFELLHKNDQINYIQIFENRGGIMGCSNPHPHCQIWASSFIPQELQKEIENMQEYTTKHCSCMLCDYAVLEQQQKSRVIYENDSFLVVVPYWAIWPYETLVISKKHIGSLLQFDSKLTQDLASIMKAVSCKYDNLFRISFPYSMGLHQAPSDGKEHPEFHFHIHYYPPLLRSATVKKFMVGYEMLAEGQRDITPEQSASTLAQLSDTHYKQDQTYLDNAN
mmetsp:Transcript_12816/g.17670  ORF Transcript_12816/g.17670 Transcript_12816/m.17670 type:complete len:366 (-) Transcript_12816:651-1748(-)